MSSEAVAAEEAPPPPPPAEGGGGADDAPAPAEAPAEAPPAPAEAPPAPAEGEAKEAEAPAEAPPPAPDEQQQPGEAAAPPADAPAEAAEAPAAAVEEAAPAPVSGDEESQRATTAEVVKELLGVALKEAAGAQKGVTYEGEAKPAAGSEDRLAPSAEDAGIQKPAPVPSEFKKEELVVKDRKSKQSMAKVHKSSFRFRTMSGSAMIIQAGKGPKYENSYWLTSKTPFNVDKVNAMLREVVDDRVSNVSSEKPKLQELSSSIATELLAKIKQMSFERYRFACVCLVGEKIDQGLRCSLRMLWDAEQDNYAWYTVEQTRYFVVASICGIYYD